MAITNNERVGRTLDLLKTALRPFIERELRAVHKDNWVKAAMLAVAPIESPSYLWRSSYPPRDAAG